MTDDERRKLDTAGYLVIERLMDERLLDEVRRRVEELFTEEGAQAGAEFKQEPHSRRLANLVDKGEVFERVIETPRILECMLRPETQSRLSPSARRILAVDDPLNDELSSQLSGMSGFLK